MNVAKKAIENLKTNQRVASLLASSGMSANDLTKLAMDNPAYVALGSIGPDLFVFVPDFKPPFGPPIRSIASFLEDFYNKVDPYIADYEAILEQTMASGGSIANALTGGLLDSISGVGQQLSAVFLSALEDFATTQYDWWGIMGSGVPAGYDEQTFFWSDMLHYRKTYEFGASLWRNAKTDQERAYALGWMTHLGTDVVGHSYVNEKCGGPFRLHWQRHHVIETHMDAYVYGREFGSQSQYQSLCGAAQHLWIAFEKNGTSHSSFFQPGTRPPFDPNDASAMKTAWDVDSDLPDSIKDLLVRALAETYPTANSPNPQAADDLAQCADHPSILPTGYPTKDDINTAYFYLYKYVKMITTDYYKLQPPEAPPMFPWPDFPSPPGSPENDGSSDGGLSLWDILLSIFAWILYIAECLAYLPAMAAAGLLGPVTYPVRDAIYQYVELPLYNIWLSLHYLRALTGYATPLPKEITPALHTLGIGFVDNWSLLEAELADLSGGLLGSTPTPGIKSEPSGSRKYGYPLDAVMDPKSAIPTLPAQFQSLFNNKEGYSEFVRPWRWPAKDMEGDTIPTENPNLSGASSPFVSGMNPYDLMADMPGDNDFRHKLEQSKSADETVELVKAALNGALNGTVAGTAHKHLGDPADYSAYVIATLTRNGTDKNKPANFNLDADRGYGFKCWDWKRRADSKNGTTVLASPDAYQNAAHPSKSDHQYFAPQHAGAGWEQSDLLPHAPQPASDPVERNLVDPVKAAIPVAVRYIDNERKY
jgi:hypothetical protein